MKYLKLFEDLRKEQEELLTVAVKRKFIDYIKDSIKNKTNCDDAFLEACYDGDIEIIKLLIDNITTIDCTKNYKDCMYWVLNNGGFNIFKEDQFEKLKNICDLLFSKGAKKDSLITYMFRNFHYSRSNDIDIKRVIDYLIDSGVNIEKESANICSNISETNISEDIFLYLIENGLKLNVKIDIGKGWEYLDWVKHKPVTNIRKYVKTDNFFNTYLNINPLDIDYINKYYKVPKDIEKEIRTKYDYMFNLTDIGLF